MTIRVAFDVGEINIRHGGVAPYASRLIEMFEHSPLDEDIELTIVNAPVPLLTKSQRLINLATRPARLFSIGGKGNRSPVAFRSMNEFWRSFDIYHSPSQVVRSFKNRFVVTMHDVQELHFPEYFSSQDREHRAIHHRRVIESANAIVVSFDHVRRDITRLFDVQDERVRVVDLPLEQCQLPELSASDQERIAAEMGDLDSYILYPAQTWPHKNHLVLLESLAAAKSSGCRLNLICTGHLNEYYQNIIAPKVEQLHLHDSVKFLGVVSLDKLNYLYRQARGVVIPTKYEAGSFPLIESMMLGVPVICARTTSLPSTIGEDRFVFDHDDINTLAAMLHKIEGDEEFRKANRLNSLRQVERWKGRNVADQYASLWKWVANMNP